MFLFLVVECLFICVIVVLWECWFYLCGNWFNFGYCFVVMVFIWFFLLLVGNFYLIGLIYLLKVKLKIYCLGLCYLSVDVLFFDLILSKVVVLWLVVFVCVFKGCVICIVFENVFCGFYNFFSFDLDLMFIKFVFCWCFF